MPAGRSGDGSEGRLSGSGGGHAGSRHARVLAERRYGVRHGEGGMPRLMRRLDPSRREARPVRPEAGPKARERLKKARPG